MRNDAKDEQVLRGRHISLLILQHLANAPRAQKEASALRQAGAEVTVHGCWWNAKLVAEDLALAAAAGISFLPLADLSTRESNGLKIRLMAKIARVLFRRFGIVLPESFGLTARAMLRAIRLKNPDLTMVHCEPGLWAGARLMQRGYRVGVDFEDWFSKDLLAADRTERPVAALAAAERQLLRQGAVRFTTTRSMATDLQSWAATKTAPICIPNCFPPFDSRGQHDGGGDPRNPGQISFYWFSQTIGPGRGLEELACALAKVTGEWQLHLRGKLGAYNEWYLQHFPEPVRRRVVLLDGVSNRELPLRTQSHDVGLALEIPFCRSRDLTATNKIFEYLRCGLAVVATATAGQLEVMRDCPAAGWVVAPGDIEALTQVLQNCVDHPESVAAAKDCARRASETVWAWEKFAPRIVNAAQSALSSPPPLASE